MKRNMGNADRLARTLAAVVFGILIGLGRVHGVLAIVLGVLAIAFLVTSLFGFCPAYIPLKWSTAKRAAPANK